MELKRESILDLKDHNALIKRIKERKLQLKNAQKELEKHFVGISDQITAIFSALEAWFCLPELLCGRPTIICLFGSTGVGKTDLVRRLVKALNYTDKYCEIELSSKNSGCSRNHPKVRFGSVSNGDSLRFRRRCP